MNPETRGPAVLVAVLVAALLILSVLAATANAAGWYLHTTTDPAYFQNGQVVQDPYGVGEGEGASNVGNHVAYEGIVDGGDDHYVLEKAGWPYDRTRVVLTAAFPCIPDRFCFDHDAAAQLLAAGMGWPNLHALYEKR
tara:strand:+ start:1018 stop:1431 length:414 start_codon:yes stop_codon:yes gene_type:complete